MSADWMHVGAFGHGDACCLEDIADLPGAVSAGGDDHAILLDGCLLKKIEVIEERLPLGFVAPWLRRDGSVLWRGTSGIRGCRWRNRIAGRRAGVENCLTGMRSSGHWLGAVVA